MIPFSLFPQLTSGTLTPSNAGGVVRVFRTDSRKGLPQDACFVAIRGLRHDGHDYIAAMYEAGVRMFMVERALDWKLYPDAAFFQTNSSLHALQEIAAKHRSKFGYPVVGITGSNAKTIVKEWIYQLLSPHLAIVKNPGSYNSQLGVPLSVLQMHDHHELGVFEAGISLPGEMQNLQKIIQPTIGIFTNIGSSHDAGFESRAQKVQEKLKLFSEVKVLIYCRDYTEIHSQVAQLHGMKLLDWGQHAEASIFVRYGIDSLEVDFNNTNYSFPCPFADHASRENLTHCVVLLLHMGIGEEAIREGIESLKSIPMRLEIKQGVNQSLIIDDTYNNDLAGLQISLDFLAGQQKPQKVLILSDVLQSGLDPGTLSESIASMVKRSGVRSFIGIGPVLCGGARAFDNIPHAKFYPTTEAFLTEVDVDSFQSAVVLVKGARAFRFETIVHRLQRKVHGTVMEIDLNNLVHNLNHFKSRLRSSVKLMVMVKAFAYGSGSEEVANVLQYHQVDYLGVAYADEGIDLRKSRISLPIMVMNPSEESFASLLQYNLEPEIYSLRILKSFVKFLGGKPWTIHIKFDTGMHRLGFEEKEMGELLAILRQNPQLKIATVFTHLAGSDESEHDAFSRQQVEVFQQRYEELCKVISRRPVRHVLNSPGILRFPDFQFEMVRLGIGLYGIDPTEKPKSDLLPVATLKTVVSQLKFIPAGETIGYGRKGKATHDMQLATIAIGYADGYSRAFSRGVGHVLVRGKRAPVVGNVCMDMTMVDVTGIDVNEGEEVIVFGQGLPISEVASWIRTIPYEILTSTSERVKRVFHAESI